MSPAEIAWTLVLVMVALGSAALAILVYAVAWDGGSAAAPLRLSDAMSSSRDPDEEHPGPRS